MALLAQLLLYILIEVVCMARSALIMPGALKSHGAWLRRHMASVTIKPYVRMEGVKVKSLRFSLRLGL